MLPFKCHTVINHKKKVEMTSSSPAMHNLSCSLAVASGELNKLSTCKMRFISIGHYGPGAITMIQG